MTRTTLLLCGIVSVLLYFVMNVLGVALYPGYDWVSQTVSELSAIGAPTRTMWVWLALAYTLLVLAFGFGVRRSAGRSASLRIVGTLLIIQAVVGLGWPPMHQREVLARGGGTLTDTLHVAWAMVTSLLFLLAIAVGAAGFETRFRVYSIATLIVLLGAGAMTAFDGPKVGKNLPTPWIGVWERINIGAYLAWVVVLAVSLLRVRNPTRSEEGARTRAVNAR